MKLHPEIKAGERFLMNGTKQEFEKLKRDPEFKGRVRMGKVAWQAGYTMKAPSSFGWRPIFVTKKGGK